MRGLESVGKHLIWQSSEQLRVLLSLWEGKSGQQDETRGVSQEKLSADISKDGHR